MESTRNKYVVTKKHIDGAPNESDFSICEELLPLKLQPADHQDDDDSDINVAIIKNLYLSVDPYQLNRMKTHSSSHQAIPAILPGQRIEGSGVGRVVDSSDPNFKRGDLVAGLLSWGDYTLVKLGAANGLRKLDTTTLEFPLSYYAGGVLGSSGLTAYGGFFKICKPKKGDKVFVSAACGSVGILVGQYAKLFGCYVVGCAGTKQKYFPEGIDIYFDNVGGEMLEAAVERMNAFGRVGACGVISEYTDRSRRAKPDMLGVVYRRIKIEGFLCVDFMDQDVYQEFVSATMQHLRAGEMKVIEDVSDGVDSIPAAFVDLFRGNNVGKKVVRIA